MDTLDLQKTDPIERLAELCSKISCLDYTAVCLTRRADGILVCIKLYHSYSTEQEIIPSRILAETGPMHVASELQFVKTADLDYAVKVTAAVLLEKMGLGVHPEGKPEESPEDEEPSDESSFWDLIPPTLRRVMNGESGVGTLPIRQIIRKIGPLIQNVVDDLSESPEEK